MRQRHTYIGMICIYLALVAVKYCLFAGS